MTCENNKANINPDVPWYRGFSSLLDELEVLRLRISDRATQLGMNFHVLVSFFQRDLIARVVHESNWQEGIQVPLGRTRELSDILFDSVHAVPEGRLDLAAIVESHRALVIHQQKRGATVEEIAAINLSRAHLALYWIYMECVMRRTGAAHHEIRSLKERLKSFGTRLGIDQSFVDTSEVVEKATKLNTPLNLPLKTNARSLGELYTQYTKEPPGNFDQVFIPTYLHALHAILMMGISDRHESATWRTGPVGVGNPDLVFPPAECVPSLMDEFCRDLPVGDGRKTSIADAARFSYLFVRIHPYTDGNGRMSRLIMNLLLLEDHPPVSVASKAKGRHRYRVALRRADRGQIEPLMCLIAIGIREEYKRMLDALLAGRAGGMTESGG